MDLSKEVLTFFEKMMLAQAQVRRLARSPRRPGATRQLLANKHGTNARNASSKS